MIVSERKLISQLRRRAAGSGTRRSVIAGIGDDCAALRIPAGHEVLVTTDFSLEGTHFRREWHPARSAGHRCLLRGLSDIAAMGGEPVAAFLSLAVPQALPPSWLKGFLSGLLQLAKGYDVQLAGGDTAASPDRVLADIVVIGTVPRGKALLRSGARPGDRLYVTGNLGAPAAIITRLQSGPKTQPSLPRSYLFPQPRVGVGRVLRQERLATAMIDVSDGLSTDLSHICEESGVGAEVREAALPLGAIGKPARQVAVEFGLHGGDDYELLFTASAKTQVPRLIGGIPITQIGEITHQKGMRVIHSDGTRSKLQAGGWEHFRP